MADRLKRGSAPGRARSEDQRPGSFKRATKSAAGRQRGTPNKFSSEYKKQIFEAANRVGMDAAGTLGIIGYFRWIARRYPRIMGGLLGSVMELQELEIGQPQEPRRTAEQLNEVAAYFGFGSNEKHSQNPLSPVQRPIGPDARTGRGGKRNPLRPLRRGSAPKAKGGRRRRTNPLTPICLGRGPAATTQLAHSCTSPSRTRRSSARCFRPRCRGRPHGSAGLPRGAPGRNAGARRSVGAQNSTKGRELRKTRVARISRKSLFLRTIFVAGREICPSSRVWEKFRLRDCVAP